MSYNRIFTILCCLLSSSQIEAIIIGSTTAVSVQPAAFFPASDLDNAMEAFGWFKYGFTLEDNTTTCTFRSVYPVTGAVQMNGGTLFLDDDLIFKNTTNVQGLGSIIGNFHVIDLAASTGSLPADANNFANVTISFDSDLIITSTVVFSGNCTLVGNGNALIIAATGAIEVDSNSTLELRDLEFQGTSSTNFECLDDSGAIVLNGISWKLGDWYHFTTGSFQIKNEVTFQGVGTFWYDSAGTTTILPFSQLTIGDDLTFLIGKKTYGAPTPIAFVDDTSIISLNNCTFVITQYGLDLLDGQVLYQGNATVDMQGTGTDTGVIMGNGDPAHDITLNFAPGAALFLNSGFWVYNNGSPNKLLSTSSSAHLVRGINSNLYIQQSLTVPEINLQLVSDEVPPIVIAPTATLLYNNTLVTLPGIEFTLTGDQPTNYTYYLNGNDSLFLSKGILPLYILVGGMGNTLIGNGGISGSIILNDSSSALMIGINGFINNAIMLNGGTTALMNDISLQAAGVLYGPGVMNLGSNTLVMNSNTISISTPLTLQGTNGVYSLRGDLTVTNTLYIQGSCTIDGVGNSLILGENGIIIVESGSQLTFANITVLGAGDPNIICADNTAGIVWSNANVVFESDYAFTEGSMIFQGINNFSGAFTFTYESLMTSTIQTQSQWQISDMNLVLGRNQENGAQPLAFTDPTSVLNPDNCNFTVTSSGLALQKGAILFSRAVMLDIQSTSTDTGIVTGDGVNPSNDFIIQFAPGSSLTYSTGHFTYKNTDPTLFKSSSTTASFVRGSSGFAYIAKTLQLPQVTIRLLEDIVPPVIIDPAASIQYRDSVVQLPETQFSLTADQFSSFVYTLDGNSLVSLNKGTMPVYLMVSNSGNQIIGNGGISGMIIFMGPTAQLTCGLNGFVNNLVELNYGTFYLTSNLLIAQGGNLVGPGTVNIGSTTITFGIANLTASTPLTWQGTNGVISLQGKTSLQNTWTISGNCIIDGNENRLSLDGGSIVVAPNSSLTFRNVEIYGLSGTNISCADDTGCITYMNVDSIMTDTYYFTNGSMQFNRDNSISGYYRFSYDSDMTSTINDAAKLTLKDGVQFYIGRNNGNEPLSFATSTAQLKFDNSSLYVKATGMTMTTGLVTASRDVEVNVSSMDELTGLQLGDGSPADDMTFMLNPGATARFTTGFVTYDVTNGDGIRSRSQTGSLIRGAGSIYHLKQSLALSNLTVSVDPASQLFIDSGSILSYQNGLIEIAPASFNLTGVRYTDYEILFNGNGNITMVNGTMPFVILASGSNNTIDGVGNFLNPIILTDPTAQLSIGLNGLIFSNLTLNGATLTLISDLYLANNVSIADSGTVNLGISNLNLGSSPTTWNGSIEWIGDESCLVVYSQVDLQGTWTFSGNCEIKGNRQTLTLGEAANIVVAPGSQLYLRDLKLNAASGTKISCADNTASIVLDNVTWVISNQDLYQFTNGSLIFNNSVLFQDGIFAYQSSQTSTISSNAKVTLDTGFTFSYDPIYLASKTLLAFEDDTSTLVLKNASFHATTTGAQLTNGTIEIMGVSSLSSEIVYTESMDVLVVADDEGITLGNGNSANDCTVQLDPAAILQLSQGSLNYNNVSSDSWIAGNPYSALVMFSGTTLRLYQSLNVAAGQVQFNNNTILATVLGAEIIGSQNIQGAVTYVNL